MPMPGSLMLNEFAAIRRPARQSITGILGIQGGAELRKLTDKSD
jgi:hypothetical protein